MSEGDELVEGRARRGRALIAGGLGLALLAALPLVSGLLATDGPVTGAIGPTGSLGDPSPPMTFAGLSGRLVYVADEPGRPDRQRLWVLDVATGFVSQGPRFPNAGGPYELLAAGPQRAWPILLRHGPRSFAYLFPDLGATAEPLEIGRADLVALSSDGNTLLLADAAAGRSPGCEEPSYRLRTVEIYPTPAGARFEQLPCGRLTNVMLYGPDPVVTVLREGQRRVFVLRPDGADELFQGVVALGPSGVQLIAARGSRLLVWPGGGALRPIVTGSQLAGSVLATTFDGRYVAVDGRLGDDEGIWVVDVPAGTAFPVPPRANTPFSLLSDATFDGEGRLFTAGPGRILEVRGSEVLPIRLPPGAPPPVGPVVWVP